MLEVDSLHSGYGRIPILDGVSLSLEEGEVVGILGHNGMGKTTLLRALIGEIKTNQGAIRFDGEDVTRLNMYRRARRGMGYVPQGRDIYPQLSVLENLKMGEVMRGGARAIPEMLEYIPALEGPSEPARPYPLRRRTANSGACPLPRRAAKINSPRRTHGRDTAVDR